MFAQVRSGYAPRMSADVPDRILIGTKVVNLRDQRVEGEVLSDQDCRLLAALASRAGEVVSKETLYREVWGYQRMPRGRALDFAIRRLRERLEEDPSAATELLTERGRGFRLRWTPALAPAQTSEGRPRFGGGWVGPAGQRARLQRRLEEATGPVVVHGPPGVGRRRWIAEALGDTPCVDWVETQASTIEDLTAALAEAAARAEASPGTRTLVVSGIVRAEVLRAWLRSASLSAWARVVVSSSRRLGVPGEVPVAAAPLGETDARSLLLHHLDALGLPQPEDQQMKPLLALLEGLPLAILLVAPHLRVLTVAQLTARLPSDPSLLADPQGGRSLVAKVEAAVSDLTEEERAALALLTSFPAGLPVPLAEQLLGEGALVILAGLGDLGILSVSAREEGRVRVLGPVALVFRADSGARGSAAVAAYLAALSEAPLEAVAQPARGDLRAFLRQELHQAEAWVQALGGHAGPVVQASWLRAFAQVAAWRGTAERRAALLAWGSLLQLGPEATAGLVFDKAVMLAVSSRWDEAWQCCHTLESLDGGAATEAWAARGRAVLQRHQLAFDEALFELDAAEAMPGGWPARDRGELVCIRHDLLALSGQPEAAAALVGSLAAMATEADDDALRMQAGVREAFHRFRSGDHAGATATCRRLLPLAQRLQNAEGEASLHRRLALYLTEAGEHEAARRSRKAALRKTDPDRHPGTYARLLAREAEYLEQKGEVDEAGRLVREACARARTAGGLGPLLVALRILVVLGLGTDPYPYDAELDEFETLCVDSEEGLHQVTICFVRGMLACKLGELDVAQRLLRTGLRHAEGAEDLIEGAEMLVRLGCLAALVGDPNAARSCLDRLEAAYGGEIWGLPFRHNRWYQRAQAALKGLASSSEEPSPG